VPRYRVRLAADVPRDLTLIAGHLLQVYHELGDDLESAAERAAARIDGALGYLRTMADHPHRGTEHPRIRSGIRTVTNQRFIFYFEIDEPLSEVRILAVFFGGMDHRQQILDRLS
jgi:plasmid stabilization system protein ParE